MSSSSDNNDGRRVCMWWMLPDELMINIFMYLRAVDLSQVSCVCVALAKNNELMNRTIQSIADSVYGHELTDGFSFDNNNNNGVEALYQLELLVLARILARPSGRRLVDDETNSYYFVSKSWIQTTLKWLSTATSTTTVASKTPTKGNRKSKKKKQPRKQQRQQKQQKQQQRPWPNINSNLCCPHGNLLPRLPNNPTNNNSITLSNHSQHGGRNRSNSRDYGDLVTMDQGAWHVLKKLYPSSTPLALEKGECMTCRLEYEQYILQQKLAQKKEEDERKKPLSCPIVRRVYHRRKGMPTHLLQPTSKENQFQLVPNHTYHAIPRSWCRSWRKYIKTGQSHDSPMKTTKTSKSFPPPDASLLLCAAHKLPQVPPHLEEFIYGDTNTLFDNGQVDGNGESSLDSNNQVVVEVLSEEEFQALSQFWPGSCSSNYSLSFTITHSPQQEILIDWTTNPCRACDNRPRTNTNHKNWKHYH